MRVTVHTTRAPHLQCSYIAILQHFHKKKKKKEEDDEEVEAEALQ